MAAAGARDPEAFALSFESKPPAVLLFHVLCGLLPIAGAYAALLGYFLYDSDISSALPPSSEMPDLIAPAIPWFVVAMLLEVGVQAARGAKLYRLNDSVSSLFAGANSRLVGLALRWFAVYPYAYAYKHWRIATLPASGAVSALTFIVVDFGYYLFHRLGHEYNLGWAVHITHHNSEEYNLSTALRQGALQPLFSWPFSMLAAYIGVPLPLVIFHSQVNTLYQFWIHTRLIGRLPAPLEWLFNTPSHHRVHHGRNPQYIDKNYGGILIVFDRLFGTFEPEGEEVVYGVTHSLGSWSPLEAQLHHFAEVGATLAAVRGWWTRVKVLTFYGPAFNYRALNADALQSGTMHEDTRRVRLDWQARNWAHRLFALVHLGVSITLLKTLLESEAAMSTAAVWIWSVALAASMIITALVFGGSAGILLGAEALRLAVWAAWFAQDPSEPAARLLWRRHDAGVAACGFATAAAAVVLIGGLLLPREACADGKPPIKQQ